MEIKTISQKIFRTKSSNNIETNCSNQTNPFGVNYKGNMINADVFFCGKEKAAEGVTKRISNHINKLSDAWKVGAMGSFSKISNRFNAVGNRMREKAIQMRSSLSETKNQVAEWALGKDSVKVNLKKEVSEIRTMFRDLADARVRSNKEMANA